MSKAAVSFLMWPRTYWLAWHFLEIRSLPGHACGIMWLKSVKIPGILTVSFNCLAVLSQYIYLYCISFFFLITSPESNCILQHITIIFLHISETLLPTFLHFSFIQIINFIVNSRFFV